MVGDDRKLKKAANNRKGVVGSSGRKMPIQPSATQSRAQALKAHRSNGLRIRIPGDWGGEVLSLEFMVIESGFCGYVLLKKCLLNLGNIGQFNQFFQSHQIIGLISITHHQILLLITL